MIGWRPRWSGLGETVGVVFGCGGAREAAPWDEKSDDGGRVLQAIVAATWMNRISGRFRRVRSVKRGQTTMAAGRRVTPWRAATART